MGEYSNIYYDILCHPEKHTSVMTERAHLYYRSREHRAFCPRRYYEYDYGIELSNKITKHEKESHIRQDLKLSDTEYQDMDYDWFLELIRVTRSSVPDIGFEFQQSTVILRELISLLTTEDEFIMLPVRAVWLRKMLRKGNSVAEIWAETIKSKELYEWFNETDRRTLGFGTISDYTIPFTDNPDLEINDNLSLRDLLKLMVVNILRWNPVTGCFFEKKYEAEWESANVLYLGKPTRCLINIYMHIVNVMEGYFFLYYYDLDEDIVDRYRKGINEKIIPIIKTNVKRVIEYMASLHESDVPNEIDIKLILYGADEIRSRFHKDFLHEYGRYGIHTFKFDISNETSMIDPVTIIYMFNREYINLPAIIQDVYNYFLRYDITKIQSRCSTPRSFNKTFNAVIDNCNRLGKKKNLYFGAIDMSEKDIADCGGFREFLMNGHIGVVEKESKEPIQKNNPKEESRWKIPGISWKGVSRTSDEWTSVYRNRQDFGNIDGVVPDADSIAINNKYTEQYMGWWDLMYSTATKY